MNQKNLYLYNVNLSIKDCAKFLTKQNIKPFNSEKDEPKEPNELMNFLIRCSYLSHALNVIYSKKVHRTDALRQSEWLVKFLLQNENFSWIKDEGKLQTAVVIISGLLNKLEAADFYEEFCARMLETKKYSLYNFAKMKFLSETEILELLKTLIWNKIVIFANLQKQSLKHLFQNFQYEDLVKLDSKLRHYSYEFISLIAKNCNSYFSNDYYNTTEIKVTSIKTSNVKIKEAYLALRECIIAIFPKQKDVFFPVNAYSVLGNPMFRELNINFKDCVKLFIKSKDIKEFVTNIKLKQSDFMVLTNWSNKLYFNFCNLILLFMNNEEFKARIIKEFLASQNSKKNNGNN